MADEMFRITFAHSRHDVEDMRRVMDYGNKLNKMLKRIADDRRISNPHLIMACLSSVALARWDGINPNLSSVSELTGYPRSTIRENNKRNMCGPSFVSDDDGHSVWKVQPVREDLQAMFDFMADMLK